ncbi:C-reactive protein-like [Sardina pilchardus]|uniref:C-reactive protein-like n=1 Tax=Sardina pilchardus TaxID=27697 RepID=UPI002E1539BE
MQLLLIASVLFTACCAAPQDLSGKMFTFPVESKVARARLLPSGNNFTSATVCLRFFTDLTRNYAIFSTASTVNSNDFLIFKNADKGSFLVNIRSQSSTFNGLPDEPNTWYSICSTWDSNSGLVQVWINGNPSTRKIGFKGNLVGELNIVLGQEQDSVDGGFNAKQSFVGMITDVHMWDYVLSACEIQRFANDLNFTPGDVINWRALDFTIVGDVVIEDSQTNGCFH